MSSEYNAIDFRIRQAQKKIKDTYGVDARLGPKFIHKFGENLLVDTGEATLMTLPSGSTIEILPTTNTILYVSSDSIHDVDTITVQGFTIAAGVLTFVEQTATLTGLTKVALTTPLGRMTRIKNTSSRYWDGTIYGFEEDTVTAGVPQTAAKIHMSCPGGENQSLKCQTCTASDEYALISGIYASCNEKVASWAVVRLRVQENGGVARTVFKIGVGDGQQIERKFDPMLVIPPNTDFWLSAEADNASTDVSGGIECYLAKVAS